MIPGWGRSPGEGIGYLLQYHGFPSGSDSKDSACNARDLGSIPGLGRSPGEGHGNPFLYSCLENPHGQRSLADYSPCKEWDTTKWLSTYTHTHTHGSIWKCIGVKSFSMAFAHFLLNLFLSILFLLLWDFSSKIFSN